MELVECREWAEQLSGRGIFTLNLHGIHMFCVNWCTLTGGSAAHDLLAHATQSAALYRQAASRLAAQAQKLVLRKDTVVFKLIEACDELFCALCGSRQAAGGTRASWSPKSLVVAASVRFNTIIDNIDK